MRVLPLRVPAALLVTTALLSLTACGDADDRVIPLPDCLDLAEVYALTGPESIGITDWEEAGALAVELGSGRGDELPDAPLTIFGPGEESGTFDSFSELAVEGRAEERGVPEEEALPRPDYISSPNDNVIIDGVAGTAGSFGWVGHAFATENADTVRTLAVAGDDGRCIEPTDEAIASGAYPLSRSLYFYVNLEAAGADEAVAAYVDRFLGDEGRAAVAEAGYVPLDDEAWAASRAAWEQAGGRPGDPAVDVSGEVLVSGSSTVEPISSLVAEGFAADNPSAGISVDGPGTGDGFELFCSGETDISNASRPIEDEEMASCEANGIEYLELKVAIDGLSLVTALPPDLRARLDRSVLRG